jgi:hypothetical protein
VSQRTAIAGRLPAARPAVPLLPQALELARGAVPVADSLPVKGLPGHAARSVPRQLSRAGSIWERSRVLAHVGVSAGESYMLADKRHPHAVHEVMMISSGARLLPGLHEHSAGFRAALGAVAACFAGHCEAAGLYPVLSWSYDPATCDRESIQGEKRFHAHLIGRTPVELAQVAALAAPARAYPARRRRRTVDEVSVLGAVLAGDCLAGVPLRVLELVAPLSSPMATTCLQMRIPGGWAALADGEAFVDLAAVHGVLAGIYGAVATACLTGESGRWRRPALDAGRAGEVGLPLSPAGRAALAHYLAALRPEVLDAGPPTGPRRRDWATHVYPLAGLAYSVCVSGHRGELYAHVRPNVFSDLGGAGAAVIDGTVVKVRKGAGTYDRAELAARESFQRGFLEALRRHPLGAAALYPPTAGSA